MVSDVCCREASASAPGTNPASRRCRQTGVGAACAHPGAACAKPACLQPRMAWLLACAARHTQHCCLSWSLSAAARTRSVRHAGAPPACAARKGCSLTTRAFAAPASPLTALPALMLPPARRASRRTLLQAAAATRPHFCTWTARRAPASRGGCCPPWPGPWRPCILACCTANAHCTCGLGFFRLLCWVCAPVFESRSSLFCLPCSPGLFDPYRGPCAQCGSNGKCSRCNEGHYLDASKTCKRARVCALAMAECTPFWNPAHASLHAQPHLHAPAHTNIHRVPTPSCLPCPHTACATCCRNQVPQPPVPLPHPILDTHPPPFCSLR